MSTRPFDATIARHPESLGGGHVPGENGIWLFIFLEITSFAILFLIFMYYRGLHLQEFQDSHRVMNQLYAGINTTVMLTSSWLVATGVSAVRRGQKSFAIATFQLAIACGAIFAIVKYFEYGEKIRHGYTLGKNFFFQCYYMFTGLHLIHVVLGVAMLFFMCRQLRKANGNEPGLIRFCEVGAIFWHMVDLLWIVLFALFYLVR